MKFKYLLINLFIFASIVAIGQTEVEHPHNEPGEPNPSDSVLVDTTFVGPVQEMVHNDYGTPKTNPHHSKQRPKYGVAHNTVTHRNTQVKNRHYSTYHPEGWTHNNIRNNANPHYSDHHPPEYTKHNNVNSGAYVSSNPHYSEYVKKKYKHNDHNNKYRNPHYSEFNPQPFKHHSKQYKSLFPVVKDPQYSIMRNPKYYKHIGFSLMVKRNGTKSELKDINNIEVISWDQIVLSIFPNPTSKSKITLSPIYIPDFVNSATIQVFDLLGKIVLTKTISQKNDNSYQLDISELEKGTYLIQVVLDQQPIMNGKFIKQ